MNVPMSKWLGPSPMRKLQSGKAVAFFGLLGKSLRGQNRDLVGLSGSEGGCQGRAAEDAA